MFPSVGFGTQITKEQELAYLDKIIKISNFICSEIEYYKNRLKLIETSFIPLGQLDILIEYLNAIKTNTYIIILIYIIRYNRNRKHIIIFLKPIRCI